MTGTAPPARSTSVAANARVMIVGTALSRATGFLRILALSFAFGLNRLSDAYNLANTTPNIIHDLVVGGVLAGTLVPILVAAVGREQADEDWDAVSAIFSVATAVLIGVTTLFFALVPLLIRLYTLGLHDAASVAERRLAVDLLYLFVPQLFFYGLITLMTALLNARGRFAAPAFAPVLNNLIVIATVLAVHAMRPHATVTSAVHDRTVWVVLGVGTTLGVVVQACAMAPSFVRTAPGLRWRWRPRHPAIRRLLGLSSWTAGVVLQNQIVYLIVLVLANRQSGDLSAYAYAYILFLLPHGIFAVSVMSAVEPELAQDWMGGDIAEYRRQLVHGIKLVGGSIMPAAAGYFLLARPVVHLLLQHGNFTAHNAQTTADVLEIMAVGLPAFSLYLLLMRAYQAMQNTRTMFRIYLLENALNIALALALYPTFGVQGLAASFSLAYLGGCFVALHDLRRRVGGLRDGRLGTMLIRITFAAWVAADLAIAVSNALAWQLGTTSEVSLVLRVTVAVITGITVYVQLARVFGVEEVGSLLQLRRHSTP